MQDQPHPREVMALQMAGKVVEVGPGSRPFTVSPAAEVIYLDRSVPGGRDLNWPELIGTPFGVDSHFDVNLDTEGLSLFPDKSLDGVIASHVIEHLASPLTLLAECARALRIGGLLLLVIPDRTATFDSVRVPTPFSTVLQKHTAGVQEVDETSIREFCEAIWSQPPFHPPQVREWHDPSGLDTDRIELHRRRSIHVHCWSPEEFASLIAASILTTGCRFQLRELYLPEDYPGGHADESALLLERVPGPGFCSSTANAFVKAWIDKVLAKPAAAPGRIAAFTSALARDTPVLSAAAVEQLTLKAKESETGRAPLEAQIATLTRELMEQKAITESAQQLAADETLRAHVAGVRVQGLEASTSWRITAPLRAAVRLLRR